MQGCLKCPMDNSPREVLGQNISTSVAINNNLFWGEDSFAVGFFEVRLTFVLDNVLNIFQSLYKS